MKKSSRVSRKSWERKLVTLAVASCFAAEINAAPPAPGTLPLGPQVINGQVFFNYNGNLLQITNSAGAIINWQAFSIGADAITRFIQQSASSVVLNRVAAGNPSEILGKLQSQLPNGTTGGQVFLINPSGVFFRPGSQVDVGGLVVSTLGMSDADFNDKRKRFTEVPGAAGITNEGKITTSTGGSVYLIAPTVTNSGIIRSDGGEIILAAGKSVEIVNANSPDLRVTISAPDNQAVNLGEIIAQGGKIGIYAGLIRQAGVVNANTAVRGENGKIVFKATKDVTLAAGSTTTANGPTGGSISIQSDSGKATVAGVVEANGTQGKGGTIAVAGQQGVAIEPTARVAANGTEGGSVTLTSAAGAVTIAAPVTANATVGRAGEVAVNAATTAALASTGQLSASGGQGGGVVSVKGSGGVTLDSGSAVQAKGSTGGTVTVQADQGAVVAQGTIDVSASDGAGGNVHVAALSDITLDVGSQILVGGRVGGEAKIQSSEGTLSASGLIDGQGNDGPGGQVWLLAPRVGLTRESVVNVSGLTGGGTISIEGDTIVSAGVLQANAGDNAIAGSISLVAQNTLTLNSTSRVEAKGADINSEGGSVYFYSFGNAYALPGQVIDFSGGTTSGNGGSGEFSAAHNVTFAGSVIGNAATGYQKGRFLIDPLNASLGAMTVTGAFTVQAEDNITIDGNVLIDPSSTLTLLADHETTTPGNWDVAGGGSTVGVGSITNTGGAFTIAGTDNTSNLIMYAGGGGIGTAVEPILTNMNGGNVSVLTNNGAQVGAANTFITNGASVINIAGIAAGGTNNFTLVSGGAITQTGTITVGGTSSFNAGANAITLTQANDFTGAVALTNVGANNIAITDVNALLLDTVSMANAAGTLTVTSNGAITQNGATTITSGTGLVNINSGAAGSAITLTNNNDFRGPVRLTSLGAAGNININDINALVLDTVSMANAASTLTVTTDGAITQNGATTITTGTGLVNINSGATGSAITLTNNNDFRGPVRLTTVTAAGTININDINALVLDTVSMANAASTLTVTTDGAITQNGATTITTGTGLVNINSGATGSAITLTNNNDFRGPVRLTTVTAAGTININDINALVLDTVSMANAASTLTVTTDGAITQNGATTITTGTGLVNINSGATGSAITLTNNNDFRGAVRLTNVGATNVAITDTNALDLGTSSVGQNLAVIAGSDITQSGALTVPGTGSFTIDTGVNKNVLLAGFDNDFGSTVTIAAINGGSLQDVGLRNVNATAAVPTLPGTLRNLDLQFTNAAIQVPTIILTGTLNVLAGGAITQAAGGVSVALTAAFDAGANSITLTDAANNFQGAVTLTNLGANNIAITDANALVLGTVSMANAAGTLTVTTDGAITQNGATTITTGTGLVNINSGATGSAITLTNNNDFRGPVRLTNVGANNIAITDVNALLLDTVSMANAAGTLTVTSNGAITQNGATTITSGTGLVNINSGAAGSAITLTNNNDFRGPVRLTSLGAAGNININDINALVLDTVSMANAASTLTVTTDGAITQNGATTITSGTGLVNINSGATGSAITLTNNNDFRGPVRLTTVTAAGTININDINALVLDTVSMANAASTLTVTTDGAITQNGATTITSGTGLVNINSGATGSAITLTNNNDFRGPVRLTTVTAAGTININDINALVLDTVSMANAASTLTVTTDGAITQNGATTITTGTGLVNINSGATGSAITLTNNNDFRGALGLTSAGAAGTIDINDINALVLDTVSMANAASTLTVTTDGAITQNGATTITTGTGLVNINSGATGSAITLTNNNDFRGPVRLTNVGANNIAITDVNALLLDTVSMANAAGTLTVTSNGAITQNGATTITSGTGLVNINSGAAGSAITLTNNNDFRGPVRLTSLGAAGNININDINALVLDTVSMANAASTLTVTTDGAITQNGATTITSGTGLVNINSGATGSAITLTNNNDFRGPVRLTNVGANNIAITDVNALLLDTVSMANAASTLTVTTDGAITQNGATTITSGTGLVNINSGATGSAITLTNNNDFRGPVRLTSLGAAGNININDINALVLDTVSMANAASTLTVTTDGAITQNGATTITTGTGLVNINSGATGSAITLTNNNDFRGPVRLTTVTAAGTININDINALVLDTVSMANAASTLTVTTDGAITQNGATTITTGTGLVNINSGATGSAITLTNNNDFRGPVRLTTVTAAGTININDINALVLDTVSMANAASTLTVTTDGAITQNGATTITTGTGLVNINSGATGSAITLTNNNDFRGAVRLTNVGATNVAITDTNALDLGTSSVGQNLAVIAGSDITQSGALTVPGTGSFTIDTGVNKNVLLAGFDNDFGSTVTIAAINGGSLQDVGLRNVNATAAVPTLPGTLRNLDLQFTNAAIQVPTIILTGTLNVLAGGAITQAAGGVSVALTAAFDAGANSITLTDAANNFQGAVTLTNLGANNIAITDANALVLGTVSMANAAGTLTVTTDGAITQNGATTITTGTGLVNINSGATGSAITLTNNNDFRGPVRLTNVGANNIAITDVNALLLDTVSMANAAGTLTVTSNGAITQNGATTITSGTGLVNINSGAAGSAITLTNNNDFRGPVRLTSLGAAGNININDINALVLDTVSMANAASTLTVTTDGAITQNGATTITTGTGLVNINSGATGSAITLTNNNDFRGPVRLTTVTAAGTININDINALVLDTVSMANAASTLTVTTDGAITQNGATTITTGTGLVNINSGATGSAITLTNNNDFRGPVRLTTVTAAGTININDINALVLDTVSMANAASTLTVTTDGAITQNGATTITTGTGLVNINSGATGSAITLTNNNDFRGAVRLTNVGATNVAITDTNALDLGTSSVGQNLAVIAGSDITQSGALTVPGTGSFTIDTGVNKNVLLAGFDNDFGSTVTIAAINGGSLQDVGLRNVNATAAVPTLPGTLRNLDLQFTNAAIQVPTIILTGTLNVLAGGAITQAAGGVSVALTAAFDAGANSITLTDAANNFQGAVTLTNLGANNIAITDANALVLGTVSMANAAGTLTVTTDGAITQNGATTITTGTGLVNINSGATGSAITLTNNNDFRGPVRLTNVGANNIAITDVNALLLDTVSMANAAGTLTVTSNGAITQNGATTITSGTGLVNINSGAAGSAITLTNNNDFRGPVRLTSLGAAGNININDINALVLDTVSMANAASTLTVTTDGAITQNGATTITSGTGLVNINSGATGSAITLTNNNDFRGPVRLTNVGANNIAITDVNALLLDTVSMANAASTLTVTTDGAITQNGATTITSGTGLVNINSGATGSAITLTNNNDFRGPVRLTSLGAAGNININDINALVLDTVSMANAASTLTVTTDGAITQNGATTITTGTGLVNINSGATGSAITLTNNNDFRGPVRLTTVTAAGTININDINALVLDTVSMANAASTLTVTTDGAITQNGATTITTGTGLVNINSGATGSAITLTNNNDFRGPVRLTSLGAAGNININDINALVLDTVSMANAASTLTVTTDGAITQNGATTITSGTGLVNINSGATGSAITLTNNNDFRGPVRLTSLGAAGNININDINALVLDTVSMANAASTLTVTTDGAITQNGATTITTGTGLVNINSGATGSAITLTNNNDFRGPVRLTNVGANNIAITDVNALLLDTVSMANAAGTLTVTSNGAITQNGATTITSGTGLVNINSGAAGSAITLTNNNDFRGPVRLTSLGAAGNININDINALVLDTVSMANAASTLTVTTDGAITQNGATTITSGTGLVNINSGATGSAITLTNNNDFRGPVRLTNVGANNIAITDVNALLLDTVSMANAASTLTVTTDGAITQNGATTITTGTGLVNINSGATGSAITLTNNNDFRGPVRLTTVTAAGTININDINALVLDTVSMANAASTLTVTTDGAITQNGATTITTGTGLVNINSGATGSAITLTNNNDFRGPVRLTTVTAAGTININDINALVLDTVSMANAASTLTVTTDGAITQNGATTITSGTGLVNINSGATGSAITLTNNNDFRGAVRLTNVGANNIAITDVNALLLDTVSMANAAGTLTVTSNGAITQNGATTITSGTGLVNINSGAAGSAITLTNNNDFRGPVRLTSLGAAGNININDINALVLDTVSMANAASTLTVTTDGAITQNGATTITTGTGLVNINSGATGSAITLTNNNDFRGPVRLTTVTAAGTININDINALVLDTVSMANAASTLTVTTDGAITQNGATTITSGTGLVNINSGATGSPITLTNNNDFRGPVTLTSTGAAGNVAITDINTLTMGILSIGHNFAATSTGATTLSGALTTSNGGTVTLTNGGLLSIDANINADGAVTQNGAGLVNLNADITTTGDAVNFQRAVTLGGAGTTRSIDTTNGGGSAAGGDITFQSTVAGGTKDFTLNAGTGGDLLHTGGVTGVGNYTLNASRSATFSGLLTASGNIILIGDELDFNGGANSISSTGAGTLLLQPTSNPFAINIGTTAGGSAASLDLSVTDLAALKDGFSQITIGRALTGRHVINIGDATFRDKLLIQSPGPTPSSSITVSGTLTMINGDDISMDTPGSISGGGLITGNSYTVIQSGGIGSILVPLQTDVNILTAANSGSGDLVINNTKSVTLQGQFRNLAAGGEVRLSTTNGSIDSGAATVSSNNGLIVFTANDTGAGGNIIVGTGGIASNGGLIALHAADNITLNGGVAGGVVSSNNNIEIIAGARGNVGGGSTWVPGLLNGTLTLPATEAAPDGNGLITLNAPVNAGAAGNVVLISATVNNTGAVPQDEIIQNADGVITGNFLTAVALRGTGGQFNGGGAIKLNQANNPTLNSAANVNLFACPEAGCPAGVQPFAQAAMIANIGPLNPPLVQYADGPIFYTSGTTNISGVGTVNDIVFYNSGGFSIDGSTMFGRKLTFETDGTVDINLLSPVTNANIQTGGFLRFVAGGSINYNSSAAGNTFGQSGNQLARDIQFVAGDSIFVNNAIYIGPTGSLTIDAYQPITFVTPAFPLGPAPAIQPVPPSGTGTVTLTGNHEVAVGGNLTIHGQNLSVLGTGAETANSQAIGQRLIVGNGSGGTGTIDIIVPGDILVRAGTATATSDHAAIIEGVDINIGSLGSRANGLYLNNAVVVNGTAAGAGVSNVTLPGLVQHSDAEIKASGQLKIFLGANGLNLNGGTATVTAAATNGQSSATANLQGGAIALDATGSVTVTAGTSTALGGLSALGADVGADTSANISGLGAATIGGTLRLFGGTATANSGIGARALARALISGNNLILTVNNTGSLVNGMAVLAGNASATGLAAGSCSGAGGVCAFADARLLSTGDTTINVAQGNILFAGGNQVDASGANAIATATAVSDSGTSITLAKVLTVNASTGFITLVGGNEYTVGVGNGKATATAAFQSTGHISLTGHPAGPFYGLNLTGGAGSGVFQNTGGTLISLLGLLGQAIETIGGNIRPLPAGVPTLFGYTGVNGASFVLSGAPPSNLDPLQAALLASLTAINTTFGTVIVSSSSSTKPNYCK